MRRLLVVLFVLAVAGCSTDESGPANVPVTAGAPPLAGAVASATGSADGPGSAAAGKGPVKAICDQATRVSTQFAATFAQDIKALIDASSKSDPASADQVKKTTARHVESFAFALSDMSTRTDDAKVKAALGEMSRQVGALKGDVRKLDEKKLAAISGGLDDACGTA